MEILLEANTSSHESHHAYWTVVHLSGDIEVTWCTFKISCLIKDKIKRVYVNDVCIAETIFENRHVARQSTLDAQTAKFDWNTISWSWLMIFLETPPSSRRQNAIILMSWNVSMARVQRSGGGWHLFPYRWLLLKVIFTSNRGFWLSGAKQRAVHSPPPPLHFTPQPQWA